MAEQPDQSCCRECGGSFPTQKLIVYGESFVCLRCKDQFVEKLKLGVSTEAPPDVLLQSGPWRDERDRLTFPIEFVFPNVCVLCGDTARGKVTQRFRTKRGTVSVELPVCGIHFRASWQGRLAFVLFAAFFGIYGIGSDEVVLKVLCLLFVAYFVFTAARPRILARLGPPEDGWLTATGASWLYLKMLPPKPSRKAP